MDQDVPQPKLLIATHNSGKMREYRQLLQDVPFELVSLDDLGVSEDVEETGETFEENARLKASAYARFSRAASEAAPMLVLADDSGLEVDALGRKPGIRSARYGGDACATDADRVALLLSNLEQVPWEKRTARFRCVIAIAVPSVSPFGAEIPPNPPFIKGRLGEFSSAQGKSWNVALVVGSVAGMIQYKPQGDQGFGYDPVFYLPTFQRTMAQLPLLEKNRISHRSDAARKAVTLLKRLFAASASG